MHDEKAIDPKRGAVELLAELCNQAIALHGSDRAAVEKFVEQYIARLPREDRKRVFSQIDEILRFGVAPHRKGAAH